MQLGNWSWMMWIIAVASLGVVSTLTAYARPNPHEGQIIAGTCDACHGNNGISVASSIPNLAGQHYTYLFGQLKAFKHGTRKSQVMNDMARTLTKKQMQDLAAYYASIPIKVRPKRPRRR